MTLVSERAAGLALLTLVHNERPTRQVVVGAAIIAGGRVLACARSDRPETAGRWEFPGGKVEPGEDDATALARECLEELSVRIDVGARVGEDVELGNGRAVLRVYTARLCGADEPRLTEHQAMRWLAADELFDVAWLPADVPIAAALGPFLAEGADGEGADGEGADGEGADGEGADGEGVDTGGADTGGTAGRGD
jgi:8-oxo-dGTP diphosphatase